MAKLSVSFGFRSATPFTTVQIRATGVGYMVMDDLRFGVAPAAVAPEPGSLALVATGLGLAALGARRRARA